MWNTWRISAVLAMVLSLGACQLLPGERVGQNEPTGHTHITGNQIHGSYALESGFYASPTLRAVEPATRLGMMLDLHDDTDFQIETQGVYEDGSLSEWALLEQVWSEGLSRVYRASFSQAVTSARIRLAKTQAKHLVFLDWSLTNPEPVQMNELDQGIQPGAQQVQLGLAGYLEDLGITARAGWGAAESTGCGYDISKYRVAIHHTASPPGDTDTSDTRIRQIQSYHINGNGWCDVGYHFLVTQNGQIWEGRPLDYQGAHVGSNNSGNAGISIVGCFEPGACDPSTYGPLVPPEVTIDAVSSLVAVLSGQFSFGIDEDSVKGHRDHASASTSCPGENLHSRLDDIRNLAAGGVTNPGDGSDPSDPSEPDGGSIVQGVVFDASLTATPSEEGNLRLDGATIVSSDGESLYARESDAFWSFELAPGSYEITASAEGYVTSSRTVVLEAGDSMWASIGLFPVSSEQDEDSETNNDSTDGVNDDGEGQYTGPFLESSPGRLVEGGAQSIPQDEEPSDANLPTDPEQPEEDGGCSQTGSQNLLMGLLGGLWLVRRRSRIKYLAT